MEVKQQLNIQNRTLLLGVPQYDSIPQTIIVDGKSFNVIGCSSGIKPPYLSLEIEETTDNLVGKILNQF